MSELLGPVEVLAEARPTAAAVTVRAQPVPRMLPALAARCATAADRLRQRPTTGHRPAPARARGRLMRSSTWPHATTKSSRLAQARRGTPTTAAESPRSASAAQAGAGSGKSSTGSLSGTGRLKWHGGQHMRPAAARDAPRSRRGSGAHVSRGPACTGRPGSPGGGSARRVPSRRPTPLQPARRTTRRRRGRAGGPG